jgi:hypothetical protein
MPRKTVWEVVDKELGDYSCIVSETSSKRCVVKNLPFKDCNEDPEFQAELRGDQIMSTPINDTQVAILKADCATLREAMENEVLTYERVAQLEERLTRSYYRNDEDIADAREFKAKWEHVITLCKEDREEDTQNLADHILEMYVKEQYPDHQVTNPVVDTIQSTGDSLPATDTVVPATDTVVDTIHNTGGSHMFGFLDELFSFSYHYISHLTLEQVLALPIYLSSAVLWFAFIIKILYTIVLFENYLFIYYDDNIDYMDYLN